MSEEELLRRNNVLMSFGKLPVDMTTCETYGISGNCGIKCPLFQQGICEEQKDVANRIIKEYEDLQQENQELKEKHYLIQGGRGNCKTYLLKLQEENAKYKSVLDEIRETIKHYSSYKTDNGLLENCMNNLLQILDKVKE